MSTDLGSEQPTSSGSNDEVYEQEHVHNVYQKIASHFSSTRYKPWPIVERFLQSQKPGSIGLDIGCGNGKYLTVNRDIYIIASDRSEALAKIAAQHQPHSTVVADILSLPHPDSYFDFAISIAVVHHLSTAERRVQAISAILQTLKPSPDDTEAGGEALVYVWALEQNSSRRGWDKGDQQDVMVPWVLRSSPAAANAPETDKVFHRYYHLYEEGELERDIYAAGGRVLKSGYEKDNWWAIATRSFQRKQ
ncbi:S-adenosyl-L-methionine-dependent methyltransferase [Talaromyces proteolyticus]|uniref:S-adenosyl-L-methionine-dependent methyltransferase n=1 Tax=Talaromyces proteolyticus TaxID=1131652 RepID=A0AAD4Q5S3_9EURO|nr:S-adenosyl-L-methionine-dependent methyltransferase [Talaromyces proteolyticus]KAH8704270.1 S-adenosyl-L-methionine-dependent methyltransferase [Talaromyces proteolyticus]